MRNICNANVVLRCVKILMEFSDMLLNIKRHDNSTTLILRDIYAAAWNLEKFF